MTANAIVKSIHPPKSCSTDENLRLFISFLALTAEIAVYEDALKRADNPSIPKIAKVEPAPNPLHIQQSPNYAQD